MPFKNNAILFLASHSNNHFSSISKITEDKNQHQWRQLGIFNNQLLDVAKPKADDSAYGNAVKDKEL